MTGDRWHVPTSEDIYIYIYIYIYILTLHGRHGVSHLRNSTVFQQLVHLTTVKKSTLPCGCIAWCEPVMIVFFSYCSIRTQTLCPSRFCTRYASIILLHHNNFIHISARGVLIRAITLFYWTIWCESVANGFSNIGILENLLNGECCLVGIAGATKLSCNQIFATHLISVTSRFRYEVPDGRVNCKDVKKNMASGLWSE